MADPDSGSWRRCLFAAVSGLLLLAGCMSVDDQVRTLQQYNSISASPSTVPGSDWSVVIRNLEPLGVEMANPQDRLKLAVAYLGDKCPNGRTVSETDLASTTPGVRSSARDYVVRVKC